MKPTIPLVVFGAYSVWAYGFDDTSYGLHALLAQAPSTGSFDFTGFVDVLFKTLGPLFVLGWYMYQEKSVAEPRREKEQREEREKIAAASEARITGLVDALKAVTDTHAKTVKDQAEAFLRAIDRVAVVQEEMLKNCYYHQQAAISKENDPANKHA
jgi:hypothetical protein